MHASTQASPLPDHDLIQSITRLAAVADDEMTLAFAAREGSDLQHWHLERCETASFEFVRLITAPEYRLTWARIAALVAPLNGERAA